MKLADLIHGLSLEVRSAQDSLDREVAGGYSSDLLSDVIAHAAEGDLWLTLQTHENVVAVASMKGLCGVVLVNGREPAQETIDKAQSEGVPILVSKLPAFELAGRLYKLGLKGRAAGAEPG
jgi:hypothetical protein